MGCDTMHIRTKDQLTYGQIGRSVMIMLAASELKLDLYDRIVEGLSKDTSWKSFVKNLKGIMESYSLKKSESNEPVVDGAISDPPYICYDEALSEEFYIALQETYNVHWRSRDYISPSCFFYLVERLLILAPHSRGYFFTAKSSFVEFLMCLPSDANPGACLVTDRSNHSPTIPNFVVEVVKESLSNSKIMAEWIKEPRINCKNYFPVLLLKLFVILCLPCLNSGFSFNVLFELLKLPRISSQLPRRFIEALRSRRGNETSYVSAVAYAFKVIGDPLVIVALSESTPKFEYPDTVFLELGSFRSRNEVMEVLFPRTTEVSAEAIATKSTSIM